MAQLSVALNDGSSIDIEADDWPELASASFGTLHGGAYLIARLIIRGHADSRILAYAEELSGAKTTITGRFLAGSKPQFETDLRALVDSRQLPRSLADECLQRLGERETA